VLASPRASSVTRAGLGELGILQRIDGVARVQREQVRDVAVIVLGIVEVALPLLQLAPLADAQSAIQPGQRLVDAFAEGLVPHELRGVGTIAEQVGDDLL
jgi:hypothetical protein